MSIFDYDHFDCKDFNYANLLVLIGRYDDAINHFSNATDINPRNVQGWNNKGMCYYIIKDYYKSILCFNKVVKIVPRFADAFYLRACSKIKNGDMEEGLKDLGVAIKLDTEKSLKLASEDEVFQNLKSDERFKSVIQISESSNNRQAI